MSSHPSIIWFRRDLRLYDHPALHAVIERGRPVVPLFVIDPILVHGRFASTNRTWFLLESLKSLRSDLQARGADLVVRVGDPRTVVPAFAREVGAVGVSVSRDHGPYGRARDRDVAAALATDGIDWHAHRGNLIHEPEEIATQAGRPFSVYTPFRRAWEARSRRSVLPQPRGLGTHTALGQGSGSVDPGAVPTLADLAIRSDAGAAADGLPVPGESAARARLERWLRRGVADYATHRDRLDLEHGTSRLSADLHFGLLSPLEVVERASASVADGSDADGSDARGSEDGPRVFVQELVWREFYAHVLFHHPRLRSTSFRSEFDALTWSTDQTHRAAWDAGRTGYPVVDAAMRQLLATGWMHNRGRMLVASFLTKDLLIDWRAGEAHFMRHLVDGDMAANNGGWQWSASTGTDAQPYFRIFNPVTQGRRYDPEGAYVRRWVPELERAPTARIHAPWEMTPDEQVAARCRIGIDYPEPIVDHGEARARALAVYEAARRRTS